MSFLITALISSLPNVYELPNQHLEPVEMAVISHKTSITCDRLVTDIYTDQITGLNNVMDNFHSPTSYGITIDHVSIVEMGLAFLTSINCHATLNPSSSILPPAGKNIIDDSIEPAAADKLFNIRMQCGVGLSTAFVQYEDSTYALIFPEKTNIVMGVIPSFSFFYFNIYPTKPSISSPLYIDEIAENTYSLSISDAKWKSGFCALGVIPFIYVDNNLFGIKIMSHLGVSFYS